MLLSETEHTFWTGPSVKALGGSTFRCERQFWRKMCQLLRKNCFWLTHSKHVTRGYRACGDMKQRQHQKASVIFRVEHFCLFFTGWVRRLTKYRKSETQWEKEAENTEWIVMWERRKRGKNKGGIILTKECFFLELRSNVVWYSISTKFFRHGTLTSFFTAWGWTRHGNKSQTVKMTQRNEFRSKKTA